MTNREQLEADFQVFQISLARMKRLLKEELPPEYFLRVKSESLDPANLALGISSDSPGDYSLKCAIDALLDEDSD